MERIPLPDRYSQIAQEWNEKRNPYPASESSISNKDWVWWRCLRFPNHEWNQPVYKRVRGLGCPICTIEDKSLLKLFPKIAMEWHPELNEGITADNVAARGRHLAWWQCPNFSEHVYQASVCRRTAKRPSACPYCAGKKVDHTNSVAACRPDLLKEWHPTKNSLRPDEVVCGSKKMAWWQCSTNPKHVWESYIISRAVNNHGCPFCSHRYVSDANRLSIQAPELAKEWHPSKNRVLHTDSSLGTFYKKVDRFLVPPHERHKLNNRRLRASDVAINSKEVVWWKCRKGHEWKMRIASRTEAGQGCPYCSGRRPIPNETSLAAKYPALVKRWHPSKNKLLKPNQVSPMTDRLAWWICHRSANHIFEKEISKVVRSYQNGHSSCPFCAGRRISKDNNIAAKFPQRVKQLWHPTRNDDLKPTQLTAGTVKPAWWQCPKSPSHEWKRQVCSITKSWVKGNSGCPFCQGTRVAANETLAAKQPDLLKYWHRSWNLPLKPNKVGTRGYKLIWWRCDKMHAWQEAVRYVVQRFLRGKTICPTCRQRTS